MYYNPETKLFVGHRVNAPNKHYTSPGCVLLNSRMMKSTPVLLLAALLWGCGGPETSTATGEQTTPPEQAAAQDATPTGPAPPANLIETCAATVRQFLGWYYQNQERLATHLVLRYPKTAADAHEVPPAHVSHSGRYELSEPGLAEYVQLLDSTGFFSVSFLANKKQELTRKAHRLAAFNPADGAPPGFDAALLLYTQELYELEDIASVHLKPAAAAGQPAVFVLPVMGRQWEFTVTEQNGRCAITNIVFK